MYEIVHTNAGWHLRVRADNGEIVLSGEKLTRPDSAVAAMVSTVRMNHPGAYDVRASYGDGTVTVDTRVGPVTVIPFKIVDERRRRLGLFGKRGADQ